ncbi:peroxiredoxin family protein [candidate division KSB1 bacterium]
MINKLIDKLCKISSINIMRVIKYVLLLSLLIYQVNCGDKPSSPPTTEYGSLKITAVHDSTETESVNIELDDISMGTMDNPCILNEIEVGTHRIFASYNQLNSKSELITVEKDKQTEVTLNLYDYSPYEGFLAPDFIFRDTDGDTIQLKELKGKTVLFFLMDYT